jgi:8-oxo-dGTP diphosphatase
MNFYSLGFAFNTELTKVILITKNKPAWQAGKLNGIGGKLEVKETLDECMAREFYEETGCNNDPTNWIYVGFMKDRARQFYVNIYCTNSLDFEAIGSTTSEEVGVFSVDKLHKENTLDNVEALVQLCKLSLLTPSLNEIQLIYDY